MTCGNCERHVRQAVSALAGVRAVQVDLGAKRVTVEYDEGAVDVGSIKQAIARAGYDAHEA